MQREREAKDPAKVRAGQARQRQLREQLGEEGYRDYQRARREDALRQRPEMQRRGARNANAAQLEAWGVAGYIEQRRRAFRACAEKHGQDVARRRIARDRGAAALPPRPPDGGRGGGARGARAARLSPAAAAHPVRLPRLARRSRGRAGDRRAHGVLAAAHDERRRTMLEAQGLRIITVPDDRTLVLDLARARSLIVDGLAATPVGLPTVPHTHDTRGAA